MAINLSIYPFPVTPTPVYCIQPHCSNKADVYTLTSLICDYFTELINDSIICLPAYYLRISRKQAIFSSFYSDKYLNAERLCSWPSLELNYARSSTCSVIVICEHTCCT